VALFTERIEVKKTDMADHEIDAKIKEKLNRFMGVVDVEDVTDVTKVSDHSLSSDESEQAKPDA
jgi:hypothetical protein